MPEKVYGTQIAFSDYAWKEMNEIIAKGLDLGLSSMQPQAVTVYADALNAFKSGSINDLATLISSQAGMTLQYLRVSWNEIDAGQDEYGAQMYTITDMNIGLIVNTTTAGNANSILAALFYSDWWSNIVKYTNPDDTFVSYLLNPCPPNYHWDTSTGACVQDGCPTGYHWDTATQTCVIDTPTNCPVGTHWDAAQGKCVDDVHNCPTGQVWSPSQGKCVPQTNGQGFPWIPVLVAVGAISAVGIGGYYLYKRKKHQRPRQNNIEQHENTSPSLYG